MFARIALKCPFSLHFILCNGHQKQNLGLLDVCKKKLFMCTIKIAYSCKQNPGRSQRHHHLNDLVRRALSMASVPSIKEPHGLTRLDGKRPDEPTLIPWREVLSAMWDVTVTNIVAASYLPASSTSASSAAETAAQCKQTKYTESSKSHLLFPLAFETMGPINRAGREFISKFGYRISVSP
jgi:hypothetical protein